MIKNELGRLEMNPLPPVTPAKIVIIGEYPNTEELKVNQYFISTGADTLRATLQRCQIPLSDCYFTMAVPYLMSKKSKNIPASRYQRERERLIQEIKTSGASLVMPLGTMATGLLLNDKNLKITKILGNIFTLPELPDVRIMPNYHPAALLHAPGNYKVFNTVIESLTKWYQGNIVDPGKTNYYIIDTWKDYQSNDVLNKIKEVPYVATDIESSSLVTWKASIWVIGLCYEKNRVFVFTREFIQNYPETMQEIFQIRARFIWHNGKFDTSMLHWNHFNSARLDEDTEYLHYCLNETNGSHGLGILATMYLGADEYKSKMNAEFAYITTEEAYLKYKSDLCERVATDADYTFQLYQILKPMVLTDEGLTKEYYNLLIPAANFLRRVEQNGAKVDVPFLESRIPSYLEMIEKQTKEVQEVAAPFWSSERYKAETGAKSAPEQFNPASVKQLAWLIYDRLKLKPTHKKAKKRGTGEEVLMTIPNAPEFITTLLNLRKAKKEYSTYVLSYLDLRDSQDIIHTTFNLHITATGRLSSVEPNIQNVPSTRLDMRKAFIPRGAGRILMEVDYSGAELRVLAWISQDLDMMRDLNGDMHTETAIRMFGEQFKTYEASKRKFLRGLAKTINFGIAYGRQAASISETFNISLEEAQSYIVAWSKAYPKAWEYLQSCEADVRAGRPLITVYGRQRRMGLIHQANIQDLVNEGKNFRIQSISSDNTLLSAMEMEDKLRNLDAYIINLIHDSILIDAPADPQVVHEIAQYTTGVMIHKPVEMYNCNVPIKADVDLGPNWGEFAGYDIQTQTVDDHDVTYPYAEWIQMKGVKLC